MNILIPIIILSVIAIIAGLVLSVASIVMEVPVDEKAVKAAEILPGANCGGCGFSGCDAYAEALAKGDALPGLCGPGGAEVAAQLSDLLGLENKGFIKRTAYVRCNGTCEHSAKKYDYDGLSGCKNKSSLNNGEKLCAWGCIGDGDCVKACKQDAIHIINGVAVVDTDKCIGCGACKEACPKDIIAITELKRQAFIECRNRDKGAVARKECETACIGCGICAKNCPKDAIRIKHNLARINGHECIGCGICVAKCPQKIIKLVK